MNNTFLEKVELSRVSTTQSIAAEKKKLSEQYFTPAKVSSIMAEMFSPRPGHALKVLDPCCGVGNLSAAVLAYAEQQGETPHLTMIEKDSFLTKIARDNFRNTKNTTIIEADFFESVKNLKKFDRVILNPPYSKISSESDLAIFCKDFLGYKEGNIYSAFVSCCLKLLSASGELVAIIPRSFCNGPSFKRFRKCILEDFHVRAIHLFESRKIFWESNVLQEVVILKIAKQGNGVVRISHEQNNGAVSVREIQNNKVSFQGDLQKFIHIPMAIDDDRLLEKMSRFTQTILTIGLRASTGKVVDFRCGDWLTSKKYRNTSYLLYQDNITSGSVIFGSVPAKKMRYIKSHEKSLAVLVPRDNYVLVRRISFKESPTRIVAAPLLKHEYNEKYIGIENHLNYIWGEECKLTRNICVALFAYLSTKIIDSYIRRFSGHTQINATDLNSIPVPTLDELETFGNNHCNISMSEIIASAELTFFQ